MDTKPDRIIGSVLALTLGDAFGAPYEGGILERTFWSLLGKQNGKFRWTDDTQMSIDVIESLVKCGRVDQKNLAHRFAQSYRWSRGYGPGVAKVLKRIRRGHSWESASRSVYRDGSFGNGAAMRSPPLGLFFVNDTEDNLVKGAFAAASVTHAHPFGCEGAVLIALATALAYKDKSSPEIIERLCQQAKSQEFLNRLQTANVWLGEGKNVSPQTVAAELGNKITAVKSCVTALYLALAFRTKPFEDLLAFTICMGGDVDTIAAMACAIWGASRGLDALPQVRLEQLEQFDRLKSVAQSLVEAVTNRSTI